MRRSHPLILIALAVLPASAAGPTTFAQALPVRDLAGNLTELRVTCIPGANDSGQVRLSLRSGFPVHTRVMQGQAHLSITVPGYTVASEAPAYAVGRAGVDSFSLQPLSQAIGGLRIDLSLRRGNRALVDFQPGGTLLSLTVRSGAPGAGGGHYAVAHRVALTFDDFPFPSQSGELLALLRKYNVPATFFCIGWKVQLHPDIVRQALEDGHSLQNHTFSHLPLATLGDAKVAAELKACNEALEKVTGITPRFFRAPGSSYDSHVFALAREAGLIPVGWSVNVHDYNEPDPDFIANHVIDGTSGPTVVLLHDGVRATIAALPRIIETLTARGYVFVTVDELTPAHDRYLSRR
jgi:peptidoglycan/xylan/chitin deacetylase (PgdA/CDA1 family)